MATYFRFTKNDELLAESAARTSRQSAPSPPAPTRSSCPADAAKFAQDRMIVSIKQYYMKDYQDPDPPACGLPPTIAHCPMVGL